MARFGRIISRIVLRVILPAFIIVACFNLLARVSHEVLRISELKNEARQMDIKLEERLIVASELRRMRIILGMDDFKDAILKANRSIPRDGETQIRVK